MAGHPGIGQGLSREQEEGEGIGGRNLVVSLNVFMALSEDLYQHITAFHIVDFFSSFLEPSLSLLCTILLSPDPSTAFPVTAQLLSLLPLPWLSAGLQDPICYPYLFLYRSISPALDLLWSSFSILLAH